MSEIAELIAKLREPQVWPTWAADAADALESLAKDNERLTRANQHYADSQAQATANCAKWRCATVQRDRDEAERRAEAAERALADLKTKCIGWLEKADGSVDWRAVIAALAPSPEEPSGVTAFENCTFEPGQLSAGTPSPEEKKP